MLSKIKELMFPSTQALTDDELQGRLQMACAVLLIEVSKADNNQDDAERTGINKMLERHFSLSQQELGELVELSHAEDKEVTSMFPFTKLINEHYDYDKRVSILKSLWHIAYADGSLSPYEDSLIRKIADLLYVRHADFIQTKLDESGVESD